MGNSQLPTDIPETVDFKEQCIQTTFGSEEEMKKYYLQMSNYMGTSRKYSLKETDTEKLKILSNKLKQYAGFTHKLGEHKWGEGIVSMQKALAIYLMQNNIDSKVRRRSNDEIANQLRFMVFLAENSNLVKQLQGTFDRHLTNVAHLLKSMSAPVEQD